MTVAVNEHVGDVTPTFDSEPFADKQA